MHSIFRMSANCRAVTFMCILFYCSSKVKIPWPILYWLQVIIYLFLIERVHIVRGGTKTRLQDKLYLFNLLGLIPYCAIVILAIVFRYHALDDNGHCYIGLRRESSFPLLIYDLIINVFIAFYGGNYRFTLPVNSFFRCSDYTPIGLHKIHVFDKLPDEH